MNFKLPQSLQKKLDQYVEKSKQPEFIEQAVLVALKGEKKIVGSLITDGEENGGSFSVYSDGGARGNPGIAGCGVVIFDKKKKKTAEIKHFIPHATNNEAEYQALFLGVKKVLEYKPHKVDFYLDSELIVKQMKGIYKVKKAELKEFYVKIKSLLNAIAQVQFIHIPRKKNKLADRLANQAMDRRKNI